MNNYCTNCGKKLNKNELLCEKCNTPIVYVEKERLDNLNLFFHIVGIFLLICLIPLMLVNSPKIVRKVKMNFLQTTYVKPYLKNLNNKYTIEYKKSGKCIIAGDCDFENNMFARATITGCSCASGIAYHTDPADGCNNSEDACKPFEYLDETECIAHYYEYKAGKYKGYITVFYKDKKYSLVEGVNIYGKEEY